MNNVNEILEALKEQLNQAKKDLEPDDYAELLGELQEDLEARSGDVETETPDEEPE